MKKLISSFMLVGVLVGWASFAHAENIVNKSIPYFNGALIVVVNGQTASSVGTFTADIKDASGNPYPALTAEWISATVEMVTMNMGVTKATVANDTVPARVKIKAPFSMSGQWKLNLKLTTAAGSESHSINFVVP